MATPKVSIIVTVFNRTEFLPDALKGALNQSFQDFEIIVTDDSASPAIRAICEALPADKVRYRTNEGRLGVALNLCAAVAEARGRYIAVLNDDDIWEADFLARLVPPLEADAHRVLAFSDHWIIDGQGVIDVAGTDANSALYGRAALPEGEVADFGELVLLKNGVPLAMGSIFRVDAFDWARVVKEVSGAYDYWISCLLAASGGRAYYVAQRLTRYRVHGAMETVRKSADKNENQVYINQALLAGKAFPQYEQVLKQRYAWALYTVGKDRLAFGLKDEARDYLSRSIRTVFDKKAFACLCLSYLPAPLRSAVIARASN